MTRLDETTFGRLDRPLPIVSLPFVDTIDVEGCAAGPDEPSPCLPTATAVWYVLQPSRASRLVVDLAGSTPLDPVVRLYREVGGHPSMHAFLGCASPVWNATLSLATDVSPDCAYLLQVGTSESTDGRVVVRVELQAGGGGGVSSSLAAGRTLATRAGAVPAEQTHWG
jgi:hypothetical protein